MRRMISILLIFMMIMLPIMTMAVSAEENSVSLMQMKAESTEETAGKESEGEKTTREEPAVKEKEKKSDEKPTSKGTETEQITTEEAAAKKTEEEGTSTEKTAKEEKETEETTEEEPAAKKAEEEEKSAEDTRKESLSKNEPEEESSVSKTGEPAERDINNSEEKLNTAKTSKQKQNAKSGAADASAYFHTTITTNHETYTSGETALVSIRYTIDQNAISAGDYVIVTIPEDIASRASFSVSKQHFSSVEDLGNGRYKLVFGEDAATGLSGSMTVRVTTSAENTITDKITAGDGEKEITVLATGSGESGTGVFENEAIMKDGLGNEEMSYGGYDYSQDKAAQIGLFDSSVDQDFIYRLFINRKNVSMTNVTVSDTLPDGMYFNDIGTVTCYRIDASSMTRTDESLKNVSVSISGQTLTVHLGDIDHPVEIEYSVHVPAQTSVYLRNHSEVTYIQDGTSHKEHSDYIAQGNDYSASNGVKSVDKTVISDDPSDQWVTYTIKFWNDNSFAEGEINLTDDLDDHVKYLYADDNEYFSVTQDKDDDTVLHIINTKAIPASMEAYVTFVCDFSGVPVGYTVLNTTGGNTTKTKKIGGSAVFKAKKTVDGQPPSEGETFSFRLLDQGRRVLQTKNNDEEGKVLFDEIKYGKEDLGQTYTYYINEYIPSEDASWNFDSTEYTANVTVGSEADEDGIIPVTVTIEKDGKTVDEALFNNQKPVVEKTNVSGSKTWDDGEDQDGKRPDSITVNLYADGEKIDSREVTAEEDWNWSFEDLDKYKEGKLITYTIGEDPVPNYESKISGYDITNSYIPSDEKETSTESENPNKPGNSTESGDSRKADKPTESGDLEKSGESNESKTPNESQTLLKTIIPRTGDNSNINLWVAVVMLSSFVMIISLCVWVKDKKSKNN